VFFMTESSESDDDEENHRGFSSLFIVPCRIFPAGAGPAIALQNEGQVLSRAVSEYSGLIVHDRHYCGLIAL